MKTVGLLHKLRHRGPGQGPVVFQFTAAAYTCEDAISLGDCAADRAKRLEDGLS